MTAVVQIPTERPGMAIAGDSSGGWVTTRTPLISLRDAVNVCNEHADITPDLPELASFRPALDADASALVSLSKAA